MNRRLAVALLALGLAVGVTVVAGTTTVDTFTTDVDFQNADTATNLSVVGSGTSASLELETRQDTSEAVRPSDNQELTFQNDARGIAFVPQTDINQITAEISSNSDDVNTVYLNTSSGSTIATANPSGGQVTFSENLNSGQTYYLTANGGGGGIDYSAGYYDSPSFPYGSNYVDITAGVYESSTLSTEAYVFRTVNATTTVPKSGAEYVSQPFSGDDLSQGTVDLTLSNSDATVTWQEDDDGDGTWSTITTTTYSSSGTYTETFASTYDTVRATADFTTTNDLSATSEVNSASVSFESTEPTLDNASASPQGRPFLTGQTVNLSIPVEDVDLGTSQGDTLTATWYLNGSQVAQKTYSSNQTISADVGGIAGTNEWYVVVDDSYGNSVQSQKFQFERPSELEIRNETSPSNLVDGSTEVEVRFYLDDNTTSAQQVVTRTTTDGTVNMTGLPTGESFVAVARADGYENRRVFIESLGETQTIYLLNNSRTSVRKTYNLQDFSGDFDGEETVLLVQRNIQGNFSTVTGDFFGATDSYSTTLQKGVRHRLVLENVVTGDRRVLGSVTPEGSTETTLTVNSQSDIDLSENGPFERIRPSLGTLAAKPTTLDLAVRPGQTIVTEWNYSVRIVGGQTLASDSGLTDETASPSVNLTGQQNETLRVEIGWTTSTGRTGTNVKRYNIAATYDNPSILDGLIAFPNLLPTDDDGAAATTMIALLTTVLGAGTVATRYRVSTEGIGLTAVGTLALFSIIGWVSYAVTFSAAVAWTAMVALRRGL